MDVWEIYMKAVEEYQAKNFDTALKLLDEIKKIPHPYKNPIVLEAFILNEQGKIVEAFHLAKKILPNFNAAILEEKTILSGILNLLGMASSKLAISAAVELLRFAGEIAKDNAAACIEISNAIFTAAFVENFSKDDFKKLYAEYKKYLSDVVPYLKKFYAHEKIRVGFLSADFCIHPVINWAWALIRDFDKKFFTTYCYSSVQKPDAITEHVKATVENWRDISKLEDAQAAQLIRDDEIDILFDLSGHTEDNRLRVAAYRPATVQISGIGFLVSTGLDCFDYFLSDETCAGDESYFTEKLLRLPSTHFCYEPSKVLDISEPPCVKNGYVTFGCFNQFGKITDSMLVAWKKILDAVPNSRLLLKTDILNNDDGKDFVSNRLKIFGIDIARVELRGLTATHPADYNDVDIALDTFPYTGCVTTCEALFMGVPVVSLYGDRMGTRVGLSILKNIGLEGLAVNSYDEYVNLAVALAGDWELLKILRRTLRDMMKKSPLMDSKNYLREVEAAFKKILLKKSQVR